MFKGDKYGKPCISYWIWMDINCRIYYVALGRRGTTFQGPRAFPGAGALSSRELWWCLTRDYYIFVGWTNRFICAWKKQLLGWIYQLLYTPWEDFFGLDLPMLFCCFFLLVLFVVKVASQQIRPNKCLEFTKKDHWQKDTVPDLGSRTWISKRWSQEWSPVFFFP